MILLLLALLINNCQALDQEIEDLKSKKAQYERQAEKYQNRGNDFQFQRDRLQDARRAWGEADRMKQKAQEMDIKIKLLEQQKKDEGCLP